MDYELPYKDGIERKISALACDLKILSHCEEYDENKNTLKITFAYEGFKVILTYSEDYQYGYSFLENKNVEKCLVTKFKFDYSDIFYSIYDVHNAVEDKKFDTYDFHCLYNEKQVLNAIDIVIGFVSRNYGLLRDINENEKLQQRLDSSFDRGLELVSKKITREMLKENPEKYYNKHDFNLYVFRSTDETLTNHVYNGSTKAVQKFFALQSRKNNLLPFEERYLEYLFENDFTVADQDVLERVNKQEKTSIFLKRAETVSTLLSLVLAIALNFLIAYLCENRLENEYWLLWDIELNSIVPFALCTGGFCAIFHPIFKRIMMKNKEDYDGKTDVRVTAVVALIGIIVIALTSTYVYFDYQKAVGLNENEIYYCQHLGRFEKLGYDDVKLYLIEGSDIGDEEIYSDAYPDKRIVLVKDDDYGDYYTSDFMEYLEIPKDFFNTLNFEESFTDLEEFESFAESKIVE